MSSDNIFKRSTAVDHNVKPSTMFKDRSSPYQRPYREAKKKKKIKPNSLFDSNAIDIDTGAKYTFVEKAIGFVLSLFGKKNEWIETRNKLKKMQERINAFENIIKTSSSNTYKSVTLKDLSV
ncbi:MAG: hypothetical protein AB1782_09050 [Cyanobacteriota bacterium]